jgi:alpha-beta hydrolase superfamily lysophospholipase
MPTFDGATGRVYYKAWRVPAPRTAAMVFLHGFGEHSGLYHRLGNTLNRAGIELWALDEIGHGLTEGDAAELALDASDLSSDPFYLDELAYDPLAFTSAAGGRSLATVLPAAWAELDGFAQVPLPVLFVHGSDDPVIPVTQARDWAGRLKRARLAEFAGARHDILNETVHQQVAAAITEFILTAGGNPGDA